MFCGRSNPRRLIDIGAGVQGNWRRADIEEWFVDAAVDGEEPSGSLYARKAFDTDSGELSS